jgi:hypothetical protein
MKKGFEGQAGLACSAVSGSVNREPQNTEQGIMNIEGKENFIIRNS